jgi:transcriptional regulator
MYPPPHHQENEFEKLLAVVREFPLGMLVSAKNNKCFVTHIPFVYEEGIQKLVAHIDKSNPQLETLQNGAEVTVIFKGPQTYISPSIYTTKQLPTYNYIAVHVVGTLTLKNDANYVKQSLVKMTDFLEGKNQKFHLNEEDARMERLLPYIQAFEIEPKNWEGKFKLSQDKNKEDFEKAKEQLIKSSYKKRDDFFKKII